MVYLWLDLSMAQHDMARFWGRSAFGLAQFGGRDSGRCLQIRGRGSGVGLVLDQGWKISASKLGLVGLKQRFQGRSASVIQVTGVGYHLGLKKVWGRIEVPGQMWFGFQVTGVEYHLDLEVEVSGQSTGSRVDVVQFKSRSQGQNILIWMYIEVPGQQRFQGRAIWFGVRQFDFGVDLFWLGSLVRRGRGSVSYYWFVFKRGWGCLSSLRLALRPVRKKLNFMKIIM